MSLTRKQRKLREEIEEIASTICLDHWNIERYEADARTTFLEIMRDKIIRAEVVSKYTLLDEFMSHIICNYYFRKGGRAGKTPHFRQLWRSKHFQIFAHYILDETFLLKKLSIVRAIGDVPREVTSAISRINDVRNDLAHSFFPQNRRRYAGKREVVYNGVHLFSKEGIVKFNEDFGVARRYLEKKAFGFVIEYNQSI
jgi:hypothetical protein